jgi:nitroreductase
VTDHDKLIQALEERFGEAIALPSGLSNIETLRSIASYTSHRAWSEQRLDPALLRLLAACALSAPSKSYLQQADIIEVRDPAQRLAVEALVPSMPWMSSAPTLLVFCGNGRRFRHLFEAKGQAFTNEHLDGFFNPVVDASLVMMNFIQAALSQGLVCCPISVLRDQAEVLATILDIPEHVVPIAGLCVGYPAQERSINPRLSLHATLHVDRFNDEAKEGLIAEFDERFIAARLAVLKVNDATKNAVAAGGLAPSTPGMSKGPATSATPPTWSEEKLKQYANAQRPNWGEFVRSKKFDLS